MKLRLTETNYRVSFLDIQKLVSENNAFFFLMKSWNIAKFLKKWTWLSWYMQSLFYLFIYFFIYFHIWRLITLQYCSGFCHTLTWISHGFTCVPHPHPPFHLPLHPIPLGLPSAPALSTCLMHPTWAGGLFHPW